jgi:tyrosinase
MAVRRHNILNNATARDAYIRGVRLLKAEASGRTMADFSIPGPATSVSTYDLFVIWHHLAMNVFTPPGNSAGRNSAHRGPIFLPWHRVMLLLLEQNLQRVLNDTTFGLPYWDWAADGDRPPARQTSSRIWANNCMGGSGNPVTTGPFAFSPTNRTSWRVRVIGTGTGSMVQVNQGLRRALAASVATLPRTASVNLALALTPFDASTWDTSSSGFRNRLEGWRTEATTSPPGLHNRVHVWVGGDMAPSSSPNDPVFYLNHCNVDRLWEGWMLRNGRTYLPSASAPTSLSGHRLNDPISSPLSGAAFTPASVLNVTTQYTYDAVP